MSHVVACVQTSSSHDTITSPYTDADHTYIRTLTHEMLLSPSDATTWDAKLVTLTTHMSASGTSHAWLTLLTSHDARILHTLATYIQHHPHATYTTWHALWLITTIDATQIGNVWCRCDGMVMCIARDVATQGTPTAVDVHVAMPGVMWLVGLS